MKQKMISTVADPGFLDRGFKFTKGFNLLILPDYSLFFPGFLKNLNEKEIILSKIERTPSGSATVVPDIRL